MGLPQTRSRMPASATQAAVSAVVLNDAIPMAQAAPRNPSPRVLTSRWLTPKCSAATAIETNICGKATRCAMRILFRGLQAAYKSFKSGQPREGPCIAGALRATLHPISPPQQVVTWDF